MAPGIGTLALQDTLPDLLQAQLFDPYGQDVALVWPQSPAGLWNAATPSTQGITVRAALLPAGQGTVRGAGLVNVGTDLPIPQFELYVLCRDADLSVPGWYAQWDGNRYYPVADARNEGSQGIVWFVPLAAPRQLGDGTPPPTGDTGHY